MGKDLDRLAAEDERGDAVATVRGHDDQVAALQLCYIDDRLSSRRVLDHLRVGRERVKRRHDRQYRTTRVIISDLDSPFLL